MTCLGKGMKISKIHSKGKDLSLKIVTNPYLGAAASASWGSPSSPWRAAVDSLSLSRMERVLEFIMELEAGATGPPEAEGTSSSLTTSKVSVSQL